MKTSLDSHSVAFAALLASTIAFAAAPALSAQQGDKAVVLKNATVFDGSKVLADSDVVLVGGKIAGVGKSLKAPENARVIDCKGRWITPGLVDANTALGLPARNENEQSNEITPHLRIVDLYDVRAKNVERARKNGVTTAYVTPGELNVFGGLGAIVKTGGSDVIVKDESGLRMSLGNTPASGNRPFRTFGKPVGMFYRRPQNRMGVIWAIRKAFYDANDARETNIGPAKQMTASTKTLLRALDKELTVRTVARADQDIRTAIRLAEEFGIKIVIDGATEAYACLDYVVAAGFPVIASAPSIRSHSGGETAHFDTIALLAKAGVQVAIQSGTNPQAMQLIREAAFAVRGGLDRTSALAAITSVPAKILGIDDRVGSIATGKDADIVLWNRHPLSLSSRADKVFIAGVER